jgi:hypothetical protein
MERRLVDSARLAVRWVHNGRTYMKKRLIRLVVALGASVGLIAVVADAAYARVAGNHCEPIRE